MPFARFEAIGILQRPRLRLLSDKTEPNTLEDSDSGHCYLLPQVSEDYFPVSEHKYSKLCGKAFIDKAMPL